MKRVFFYRNYQGFSGGNLKFWDYFNHVNMLSTHRAEIYFTPTSVWEDNPWISCRDQALGRWAPHQADILILGALDWEAIGVSERDDFAVPIINFILHLRHANPEDQRYQYLRHKAIRICCSTAVEQAIRATGKTNGPVITIPNGLDPALFLNNVPEKLRSVDLLIGGLKAPELARRLEAYVASHYPSVRLLTLTSSIPRKQYLEAVGSSRMALLLPSPEEGFYLPALEAMGLGTLVICPDVGGNRGFCRPGDTAIVPRHYNDRGLCDAIDEALSLDCDRRQEFIRAAMEPVSTHTLEQERHLFQRVLTNIEHIW